LTVDSMMEVNISSVAVLVALYSAGAYGRAPWRDRVRWVCLLAIAVVGLWFVLVSDIPEEFGSTVRVSLVRAFTIALNVVYFAIGWRLGDVVRERRERGAELEERNRQLARERDENARRAVLDERVRIARDLHDVVAHHVSVMGVQAGAARRVLDKRPDLAAEALGQIEASSREAVAELQRLLGFLRSHAEQEAEETAGARLPRRSRRWTGCLTSWPPWARSCRWCSRAPARCVRCRPPWSCRRTGWCRKRSPTASSTPGPAPARRCWCTTCSTSWWSRCSTTAAVRRWRRPAGTVWSACGNGCRCTAASSAPALARAAASRCVRSSRCGYGRRPGSRVAS
jgi:hypothetical protein